MRVVCYRGEKWREMGLDEDKCSSIIIGARLLCFHRYAPSNKPGLRCEAFCEEGSRLSECREE